MKISSLLETFVFLVKHWSLKNKEQYFSIESAIIIDLKKHLYLGFQILLLIWRLVEGY